MYLHDDKHRRRKLPSQHKQCWLKSLAAFQTHCTRLDPAISNVKGSVNSQKGSLQSLCMAVPRASKCWREKREPGSGTGRPAGLQRLLYFHTERCWVESEARWRWLFPTCWRPHRCSCHSDPVSCSSLWELIWSWGSWCLFLGPC